MPIKSETNGRHWNSKGNAKENRWKRMKKLDEKPQRFRKEKEEYM